MTVPRGIRNRNPGNIDYHAANKWAGLATPPSDGRFCIFQEDQFGIRALAKLLCLYQSKHGCSTIQKIVNRWAPPVENNTNAYVNAVAKQVGVEPDAAIDLSADPDKLERLVRAIVRHENGPGPYDGEWYTNAVYKLGIKMATQPLNKSKTIQGSVVVGAATTASVVIETVQQYIPQAVETGTTVSTIWPEVAKYVAALFVFAGVILIVYSKLQKQKEGMG
jgi:hypothetical protein